MRETRLAKAVCDVFAIACFFNDHKGDYLMENTSQVVSPVTEKKTATYTATLLMVYCGCNLAGYLAAGWCGG